MGITDDFNFYVFATSAAEAEKKGMILAKKAAKNYTEPGEMACVYAKFVGYIQE